MPHPFTLAFRGTLLLTLIGLIELMVVSLFMVNEFYKSVIELYRHSKELEETNMQSRYMALHNQLNPHFLFNCLNTLVSEIEYNQANAVQFTRDLSDTYRYILYCQDKQFVSLNQELDFVDKFMALHSVRLGDCLFLDLRVSEELCEVNVLPLTLQLLVENIVKHNVISMSRPMTITIAVQEEDSDRWLCVMNPIRLKQGVVSSGKGLDNLSLRYKLMYDKDIVIDNSNQCFTVKIPLFYE